MVGKYVYVEGNNTLFYKNLLELSTLTVYKVGDSEKSDSLYGGLSSSDIVRKVKEDRKSGLKSFGIVDNDFKTQFGAYIYPIDFYCIENVSLLMMGEFAQLRKAVKDLVTNDIKTYRIKKIDLEPIRNQEMRVERFTLNVLGEVHNDFKSYIETKIQCIDTYMRYMDLKLIVEKFSEFYKQKFGKKNQIKYIEDLADKLPARSIAYIFSQPVYDRFTADIK